MSNKSNKQEHPIARKNREYLEIMPYYVVEYYHSSIAADKQLRTMNEYLKEYKRFFEWMISPQENIYNEIVYYSKHKNIKDIDVSELEHLPKIAVESYFTYLSENGLSQRTRARTYAALSSLYKYLTVTSENKNGEPYFYRNVIAKVSIGTKRSESLKSRAKKIEPKLFLGDETQQFLDFIDNEYETKLSNRMAKSFEFNKERDLAIIALLLASGIRLNECVNIDYKDLNLNVMLVDVIRKGGHKDSVSIAPFAKPYLEQYMDVRRAKYQVTDKASEPFFLSIQNKTPKRLGERSIQKLVKKYSLAFDKPTTPHKLRHTLATRLYQETKNEQLVATQLGHSGTEMVALYTQITDEEMKVSLDKL